jgi:Flp pilus assembly protein TadG
MVGPWREATYAGPGGSQAAGDPHLTMEIDTRTSRRAARLRRERGQAVTEFALVLPLLVLVVFAFVSFGKALYYYIELTHVANEGARQVAVNVPNGVTNLPGGATDLKTYVCSQFGANSELNKPGGWAAPATVTISYPDTSQAAGEPVKVAVSTVYRWFPFMDIGVSTTITGAATMRLEQDTSTNSLLSAGTSTCP